ncbi:MAG: hypothetical protein U0414_01430 [Polyangiaceae bacterium]
MGSLTKNLGRAAKVAGIAGRAIGREVKKSGVGKTIEDGGREVLRAGTNVATRLGAGLEKLGSRLDEVVTGNTRAEASDREYPKSREEFERRYGEVDGDWPRTPEEFEKRFGFPPGDKPVGPTKKDPGFRIAKD